MRTVKIGTDAVALEQIRKRLTETTLNSIRGVLPDKAIRDCCWEVGHTFRDRLMSPVVTVLHMVAAAIWPEASFAASWQLLWGALVSKLPQARGQCPYSGSVSKARQRLPVPLWDRLFQWLSQKAQELSEPLATWRGHRVVLVDGTCVSMPDRAELFDAFGTCRGYHGKGRYPLARLVALSLANTMTVIGYRLASYATSEIALLRSMLDDLRQGDLLIGDRHFAAAHYYAWYRSKGLQFLTRAHPRLKVSRLQQWVSYGANDFVAAMRVNPLQRRQDPSLPAEVLVRFIQCAVRIRGKRKAIWLVSSLLDAQAYPAHEIVQLYARRWRIETLFRAVKIHLSADVLRSQSPQGIRKEVAARLLATNILRIIMLEAAIQHGTDPLQLSFSHAVRAVLAFAPAMATAPAQQLPGIYQAMLTEIASHRVPHRPNRIEPRAVRRETKHYPTLRMTRDQWRQQNVA